MSAAKLTPAQGWTLERCLRGEITNIIEIDNRVRSALEARGLLVWDRRLGSRGYGRVDAAATADATYRGGCGECDTCQEILVDPSQMRRGLYCSRARVSPGAMGATEDEP